ncbi:MAG TPA: four helix bundle protein [Gemmatimonadaceae bacterium]|nr:four helix bundle protein [Gemmatimonadaceae bacterium]
MSDFKTLQVWQKAHALSLSVDRACKGIRSPLYISLRNQLFRAAMSIGANIAEGSSQRTRKEFGRFIGIALSSCSEVEHHLIVARDLEAISTGTFDSLVAQTITVRKMLYGLRKMLTAPTTQT